MDESKIRTRETVKDIKLLDKSKILRDKIKDTTVHTKDEVTPFSKTDWEESSPVRFAEDKVTKKANDMADSTIRGSARGTKLLTKTVKSKLEKSKSNRTNGEPNNESNTNPLAIKRKLERSKSKSSQSVTQRKSTKPSPQNKANHKFIMDKNKDAFKKKHIISNAVGNKGKGYTSKFKRIKKGVSKSLRAVISAMRSLVSAIMSGGILAVVVIIIICFIGFLAASPMGIFFSNDSQEHKMSDTISKLNIEFFGKIEKIISKKKHDDFILKSTDGNNSINWNEVLAVYAVKIASDPSNATEVISIDDVKEAELRRVLYDMNKIKHKVTTEKEVEKDKEYKVKVLTVTIHKKTPSEMATKYKFTQEQKDMLNEILKSTYEELWASLTFGSGGNGEIAENLGTGQLAWPVPGHAANTSSYGMRQHPVTKKWKMHNGTDLGAPTGTKIVAAESGKVTSAGWNSGGYGYFTVIDHGKGLVTRYAHQSKIIVKTGSMVKRGQVIGLVGSTGLSTGPHLHFEVLINGQFDNPMMYIKQ